MNTGLMRSAHRVAVGAIAGCLATIAIAVPAHADDSGDLSGALPDASVPATDTGQALIKANLAKAAEQTSRVSIAAATVTYTTLSVTGQMQQKSYWCGPASVRMALSVFGVTQSQTTLAGDLGTTSSGTYASNMPAVLNRYQSSNAYADSKTTSSSTDLFGRVKLNVSSYRAPLIPLVEGGDLPLWAANGYTGHHFVTLYGYASNDAWIQYDDPINVDAMYGKHVTNKSYLYSGMTDGVDDELVW
jgi:hypothetical protein